MLVAFHHCLKLEVPVYDCVSNSGNLLKAFSQRERR